MTSVETRSRPVGHAAAALPPALAAVAAVAIGAVVPLASPLLVALVLGAVVTNTRLGELPAVAGHAETTKQLLRWGVVLLGLRLPVDRVLDLGPHAMVVVVATVCTTYAATIVIGDRLRLDRGFVTLLAAGFSICGAAAIAAVDDTVRAKQRDVALALAMVTVFGSVMIVAVPWLSDLAGLREEQAAMWAGASIHEVAQVVAAASVVGTGAVAVATTVKLARVALLAPMYAVASRRGDRTAGRRTPLVPWFVLGFVAAVVVRSTGVLPGGVLAVTDVATTLLLAAGMFGLGLGIRGRDLWPVPARALALASASTLVAAGTSFALIVLAG